MPKFVCKFCGMITENPQILPVGFTLDGFQYEIKCPVCEKSTFFLRDKPFPTDKLTNKERLNIYSAEMDIYSVGKPFPTDVPLCKSK